MEAFNDLLASYHDGIAKVHSQSETHVYFEGKYDEQIKILIEEIEVISRVKMK